jgi:hypothetical protein
MELAGQPKIERKAHADSTEVRRRLIDHPATPSTAATAAPTANPTDDPLASGGGAACTAVESTVSIVEAVVETDVVGGASMVVGVALVVLAGVVDVVAGGAMVVIVVAVVVVMVEEVVVDVVVVDVVVVDVVGAGAAGGGNEGGPVDPAVNDQPSTEPAGGTYSAAPCTLSTQEPPRSACQYDQ